LLELYPADFREQYRGEMAQVFSETWSKPQTEGFYRRLRYGAHVLRDWLASLAEEWLSAAPWEAKLGCAGLLVAVVIDCVGEAYYPAICWGLGCAYTTIVGFTFTLGRAGQRVRAIQILAFIAVSLCFPALLRPLHRLSSSSQDYANAAQGISTVIALVVIVAHCCRLQTAPDYARPIATRRKTETYRWVPVIICGVIPLVWTWYVLGHRAVTDGTQLLVLSNALYVVLVRTYSVRCPKRKHYLRS
jgi:hypothetical protein